MNLCYCLMQIGHLVTGNLHCLVDLAYSACIGLSCLGKFEDSDNDDNTWH